MRRAAYLAWAVCAVVVWNVVFDAIVTQSGRDYLTLQALRQQGRGPAVTIRDVMESGVARASRVATASGGAVGAAGILVVWLTSRGRARGSAGRLQ
jgi:glucosamine 6-phosphate synthetase-like amidotransferase/phosphosugar isomerase protein